MECNDTEQNLSIMEADANSCQFHAFYLKVLHADNAAVDFADAAVVTNTSTLIWQVSQLKATLIQLEKIKILTSICQMSKTQACQKANISEKKYMVRPLIINFMSHNFHIQAKLKKQFRTVYCAIILSHSVDILHMFLSNMKL